MSFNRGNRHDYLFSSRELRDHIDGREKAARDNVEGLDPDQLLKTPTEDWVNYYVSQMQWDVPVLHRERGEVESREGMVEVIDHFAGYTGRGEVIEVKGTIVELKLPFEGTAWLFETQPSTHQLGAPKAAIANNYIQIQVCGRDMTQEHVKNALDKTVNDIEQYLGWIKRDISEADNRLPNIIRNTVEARKKKLLANLSLTQNLGYKVKERNTPATFVAPVTRKRLKVALPKQTREKFQPEPALDEENYGHILTVIDSMSQVMERSPDAFREMDEESIRMNILVQLNGHYLGTATGETFNHEGKTDILIRVDGKNIFIAECKFWAGEKGFLETIDQILRYLSWRDTKAAIILFNQNKDFSHVLDTIREAAEKHPQKKRGPTIESETRFRYIFGNPNDMNREIILTILAFDVPKVMS